MVRMTHGFETEIELAVQGNWNKTAVIIVSPSYQVAIVKDKLPKTAKCYQIVITKHITQTKTAKC